jgi:hypothetical protein
LKTGPKPTPAPASLSIVGSAKIGESEIVREAVPCEDRMQAFLWRHLVPAGELLAIAYDPRKPPPPRRVLPTPRVPAIAPQVLAALVNSAIPAAESSPAAGAAATPPKPKFSKQQIAGRLRQLKLLYEEGLLTDAFYLDRVAECDTPQ